MKVGTDGVLLGAWVNPANSSAILDIGAGTGLISLMLAQKSTTRIDALEIDPQACSQAKENTEKSPWPHQIEVINDSFQHYSQSCDAKYDLMVSNPPYFVNSLKAPDHQRSLARHSHTLPYDDLLKGVARLLTDDGKFYVILPYLEAQLFIVDAALYHLYCNQKLNIKPAPHKKTNRVLVEFSKIRNKTEEFSLSILDQKNEYSREYKELTKTYYLNF